MSLERNSDMLQSLNTLKTEIKALQESCVNTCHIIENAPPEFPPDQMVTGEEVKQKMNSYVKGLEAAVQNSNTRITTDANLLTSQFLIDMRQKIGQINELTAYTSGTICDINAEISRLKNLISVAQEAQSKPRIDKNAIQPDHVAKAKNRFKMMKNEVHSLIQALCPHDSQHVMSVLGDIMSARLNSTTDDYIQIEPDNFNIIEMLRDLNIVSLNPYNQFEVIFNY